MHSLSFDSNGKGVVGLTGDISKVTVNGIEWGPRTDGLREALFAIAGDEGDATVIARQALEQAGLEVPCIDQGCPQWPSSHVCVSKPLRTDGDKQ